MNVFCGRYYLFYTYERQIYGTYTDKFGIPRRQCIQQVTIIIYVICASHDIDFRLSIINCNYITVVLCLGTHIMLFMGVHWLKNIKHYYHLLQVFSPYYYAYGYRNICAVLSRIVFFDLTRRGF